MDGILTIKGFKFKDDMYLNLQNKTIITGDSYTCYELFNMLEQYFQRKNFSDHYLQSGISLILEGRLIMASDYLVFRIRPQVNLTEELKIGRKTLLGQIAHSILQSQEVSFNNMMQVMQQDILLPLNSIIKEYGVQFVAECEDIFSLSKIFKMQTLLQNEEIFLQEQDQFQAKTTLLNLISRLRTEKKKLVLLELPEYGLKAAEVELLLSNIQQSSVDNMIIFTQNSSIAKYFPNIFNYHVAMENNVLGFEDYDDLESLLLTMFTSCNKEQLSHQVLKCIFPCESLQTDNEIYLRTKEFLRK